MIGRTPNLATRRTVWDSSGCAGFEAVTPPIPELNRKTAEAACARSSALGQCEDFRPGHQGMPVPSPPPEGEPPPVAWEPPPLGGGAACARFV